MNHTEVLRRSWHTLWHYRALWIFGIILALVTFSWETAVLLDRDDEWEQQGIAVTRLPGETFGEAFRRTTRQELNEANRELSELFAQELGIDLKVSVLSLLAVLMGVAAIAYVIAKIARYVSETALIRMVGEYQKSGERLGVRQGLRLGWSRIAWRLFLTDLLITLAAVLVGVLLFGLILAPLSLWVNGSEGIIFTFAFLTGGLLLVAMGVVIVTAIAASLLTRLAHQACALEGLTATEAVGEGFRILRQHPTDAGLMWLIVLGLKLGWAVAMVPAALLLLGAGLMIGGFPALAAGGVAGLATTGDVPVFVAVALGIPLFLLVLVGPLVLLGGLREVLISSLWTLSYRELRELKSSESEAFPSLNASGLEAAAA